MRAPEHCPCRGEILSGAGDVEMVLRQVFDMVLLKLTCTEHRAMKRRWRSEAVKKAPFAPEGRATACCGANIRAVALYLFFGQFLRVERAADALHAILGVELSTGFLCSLPEEAASQLEGFTAELRGALVAEPVACVDETPHQVRRAISWIHIEPSEHHSSFFASFTRANAAPYAAGVLGGRHGDHGPDRLFMDSSYAGGAHVLCNAHLARVLAALGEISGQGWVPAMAFTLGQLNDAAHDAPATGRSAIPRGIRRRLLARHDELVADAILSSN